MTDEPHMSLTAWATPKSIHEDRLVGAEPAALVHVHYPHGKGTRTVQVRLDRADLLAVIANAADALRVLDKEAAR